MVALGARPYLPRWTLRRLLDTPPSWGEYTVSELSFITGLTKDEVETAMEARLSKLSLVTGLSKAEVATALEARHDNPVRRSR